MNKERTYIRTGMHPADREPPQHYSSQCLDKLLLEAFTARTEEQISCAVSSLADIQTQCLKHIRFLSELEGVFRTIADGVNFDMDEKEYSDLIEFISGVGASVGGVSHQLGFIRPLTGVAYEPA